MSIHSTRIVSLTSDNLEGDMAQGDVHTVKHGDGWANKVEGNKQASNTAPTKAEAQSAGRDMAIKRGSEHVVHRRDAEPAR